MISKYHIPNLYKRVKNSEKFVISASTVKSVIFNLKFKALKITKFLRDIQHLKEVL